MEKERKYSNWKLARYSNWKLAKVEELIIGKDKEARGAKVRVAGKGRPVYLKRPVQKLYPLRFKFDRVGKGSKGIPFPSGESEGPSIICMNIQDELLLLFSKRRQARCLIHR